jgi:hypothetical protein
VRKNFTSRIAPRTGKQSRDLFFIDLLISQQLYIRKNYFLILLKELNVLSLFLKFLFIYVVV